tara:strand:- start:4912 stop:5481 length:570 start_codon:yes stop_codon:yes gene_type:complete
MKAYLPIINASLLGGKGIVQATHDHTVTAEDAVGCYVTSSLITALGTTQETVDSWATSSVGDKVIPSVEIDIAACHAMMTTVKPVIGDDAEAKVQSILKNVLPSVVAVLTAVLDSNDVTCRDMAIVKGVLKYIEGAAPAVVAELAKPDGKMSLPAVTLALEGCDTSSPAAAPRAQAENPLCDCEKQCPK